MIELKPNTYNNFHCPVCYNKILEVKDIIFQGIHILAYCICKKCDNAFLIDFPIGHAFSNPQIINIKTKKILKKNYVEWFTKPLIASFRNKSNKKVIISKEIFFHKEKIIILNCIDYLYGHVLLKLFHAQYYIDNFSEYGLVIIIPKKFKWLIPKGASEVWYLDIDLKDTLNWYINLENFFSKQLENYKKVFLSLAHSHPDFSKINIERFTKVEKFNLSNFYKQNCTITFIYREDRLWDSSNLLLFFKRLGIFKLFKNFKLLNIKIQNKLIINLYREIKKSIPNIIFNVVGFGKKEKFCKGINDFRENEINFTIEKRWCKIYSTSHIVIGVHGSNMILPTSLSGSFIEILPLDRFGNFLQDIAAPLNSRQQFFLGRFLYEFVRPKTVASVAISIMKSFKNHIEP